MIRASYKVGEAARFQGCRKRRKEFLITGWRKTGVSPQNIDQKLLTSFPTISWDAFVTGRALTRSCKEQRPHQPNNVRAGIHFVSLVENHVTASDLSSEYM